LITLTGIGRFRVIPDYPLPGGQDHRKNTLSGGDSMATAKNKENNSSQSITEAIKVLDAALKAIDKQQYAKARETLVKLKDEFHKDLELRGKIITLIRICDRRLAKAQAPAGADSFEDPGDLYNLGIILHNDREYREALKCFEKALKKPVKHPDYIHYAMAASKTRLGNLAEAAKDLKKAGEIAVEKLYKAQNDPDFSALREDSEHWNSVEALQGGRS